MIKVILKQFSYSETVLKYDVFIFSSNQCDTERRKVIDNKHQYSEIKQLILVMRSLCTKLY